MTPHYSMVIQWSEDDQTFVVSLPEFGPYCQTHGDSYTEAVKNGEEVLEMLITAAKERGEPLPKAQEYDAVQTA